MCAGIGLAVVGLYLLTGADLALGRGDLLTLACAVLFAFHIVSISAYVNRVPQAPFTTAQLALVAVLCIPPTAAQGTSAASPRSRSFAIVFTGRGVLRDRAAAPGVGPAPHSRRRAPR